VARVPHQYHLRCSKQPGHGLLSPESGAVEVQRHNAELCMAASMASLPSFLDSSLDTSVTRQLVSTTNQDLGVCV
jgi:hypothetical protein